MRPVVKSACPQENGVNKVYKPHTKAKGDLETHLACYCSYCEVFSSDLEVEHVISQHQDATLKHNWDNFLLACGRCNGKDNKSNKPVDFVSMHMPHRNNTFLSLKYLEGGYIVVNPDLVALAHTKATNLLNLICLDKSPSNPMYPNFNENDTRWKHRRLTWEKAKDYLSYYEAGIVGVDLIIDYALAKGFFSVWFTVFREHANFKRLLIESFTGTAESCFDAGNNYEPVNRNPHNLEDPT